MFKKVCAIIMLAVALPLAAQVASALPADRLAFANQLARRGLHAEALKEYEAIRNEKSLPRDEVRFRLGEAYRNVGRTDDALKAYDELLRLHPQSRYVDYARLNRALLMKGEEKIKELSSLDHPKAPEQIRATALYWLGDAFEQRKDAKKAIEWYTRSSAVSTSNSVSKLSLFKSAELLAASSDAQDRRQAQGIYLNLAMEKDPALAQDALHFSAMLSYNDGNYKEAAVLFHRLSSQFPDSDRAKSDAIYAAWSNYLSGRYTEALQQAAALRDEKVEDAYYLVAASLRYLERRADAIKAYDAAMAVFPAGRHYDSEWFERLGVLAANNDHKAVLDALAKRPDPPERTAARAWSYGCEAAIAVTNFPQAIEFARLVAARPDPALASSAVHRLAWLYEQTKDWPRAALAYRTLASKWPEGPVAAQSLYLAGVAEIQSGRSAQARADWTRLLEKYPNSPYASEALYSRAMEEVRAKEFHAAERSLAELLRRFPKHSHIAESHYWRGVAAKGMDDIPEAERHFRAALAAKPNAEFEREARLELASVLKLRGSDEEAASIFASLLDTKAVDRLPPAQLEWIAESMCAVTNYSAALKAATIVERRKIDAAWNQVGATLAGVAHDGLGERDAAAAAYARALATGAKTASGARAALELGRIESAAGRFDEAKAHLSEAVERANSREQLSLRVQAYAALAANEEERGDLTAALGYHMLVGTIFDDPQMTPHALFRAAEISRSQGKVKEASALEAECSRRYPKAKRPRATQKELKDGK